MLNTTTKLIDMDTTGQKDSTSHSSTTISEMDDTDKKLVREFNRLNSNDNFMDSFKPQYSRREIRKVDQEVKKVEKKSPVFYDKFGHLISTGEDFCDCGEDNCEGCFFPCPKCYSLKCGHECRRNRKWTYESSVVEGQDFLYSKK